MMFFGRKNKRDSDFYQFLLQKPGDQKWCIRCNSLDDILPIGDGTQGCRIVFKYPDTDDDGNDRRAANSRLPKSYDLALPYWDLLEMMAERAKAEHAPFLDLCDYCLPDEPAPDAEVKAETKATPQARARPATPRP